MSAQFSLLLDTLLAGGIIQLLVGLALLRLALGLNDLVVGVAVVIAALTVALSDGALSGRPLSGGSMSWSDSSPPISGPHSGVSKAGDSGGESPQISHSDRSAVLARLRARVDPALRDTSEQRVAGTKGSLSTQPTGSIEGSLSNLRAKVIVSDLKRALLWGVALLIPFLVIDLLLAHLFAMLEWQTLPVTAVSVPLKLLVFVAVGGWSSLVDWLTLATTGGAPL